MTGTLSSTKRGQGEDRDFNGYPASVRALMQQAERGHRVYLDDGTREAYTIGPDGRRSASADYALACEHWDAIEDVATAPAVRKQTRLKPKLHLKPPAEKAPAKTRKGEWFGTADAIDRIGISNSMFKRRKAEWIEAGLLEEKTEGGRGRGKSYRFDGELCELARALVEKHPATRANAQPATDATPATTTGARQERPQPAEVSPEVAAIAGEIEKAARADRSTLVSPPPPVTPSTEVEEIAAAIEQPEPEAVPNKNTRADLASTGIVVEGLSVRLAVGRLAMYVDTDVTGYTVTLNVNEERAAILDPDDAESLLALLTEGLRRMNLFDAQIGGRV